MDSLQAGSLSGSAPHGSSDGSQMPQGVTYSLDDFLDCHVQGDNSHEELCEVCHEHT